MQPTRLILVRHGETEDNHRRVFQGQGGHGLNERGREQTQRLAARLLASGATIHALISSDLDRARETADILGAALGLVPALDPALREVNVGAWGGLDWDTVAERFPHEWSAWRAGKDVRRGGHGETEAELRVRVTAAVMRITNHHAGQTILMVSHGAALKSFAGHILGAPTEGMSSLRVSPNTGVTVVERSLDGVFSLVVWGDASHVGDMVTRALTR